MELLIEIYKPRQRSPNDHVARRFIVYRFVLYDAVYKELYIASICAWWGYRPTATCTIVTKPSTRGRKWYPDAVKHIMRSAQFKIHIKHNDIDEAITATQA